MAVLDVKLMGVFSALSEEAAEVAARVRAGVAVVRGEGGGHGAGVVWHQDGVLLTNDHVVATDRAEVSLPDGRSFPAEVFRRDPERDLAALRVEGRGLPAVPIGDSRAVRAGELVLAVGNPLGVRGAVSVGIIAGVARESWAGGRRRPEMVRADVDLYPGNSGGPLVDARGRVIGINSMVMGPGIALAVPSHVAEEFLASAPGGRAHLGVVAQQVALPESLARPLGLRTRAGLMVYEVVEGGPAEQAGMLPGDVVIDLEGRPVATSGDLLRGLAALGPHRPVRMTLIRAGRLVELSPVPEEPVAA